MPQPEAEMRNPFRNEADAFRLLVMIVVAAGIVIAAALLVSSWLGAVLGLIAICAGLYATVGWLRVGLASRPDAEAGEPGSELRQPGSAPGGSSPKP